MPNDRSSEADHPQFVTEPVEVARIEAENTLRQFDASMSELANWIGNVNYRLRVSTILRFNRVALEGVSAYAGIPRPSSITIRGSGHQPPSAELVSELMEEFCDYVNSNWSAKSAIHLAAYALWRLNWIHPFVDGNGRTARTVSYLILCARLGYRLPGRQTIPEQIAADKKPYYAALEASDKASARQTIDVSELEALLDRHLARQLLHVHDLATGASGSDRQAMTIVAKFPLKPDEIGRDEPESKKGWLHHIERHPVLYGGAFAIIAALLTIILQ